MITIALDLRALQHEFLQGFDKIISEELTAALGSYLPKSPLVSLTADVYKAMKESFESTSTMDVTARMEKVAASSTTVLVDSITAPGFVAPAHVGSMLTSIPAFRSRVSSRTTALLDQLRHAYLSGARGAAPARPFLNKTRPVYDFVRITLGIKMHGSENYHRFVNGLGVDDVTIGQNVSLIHEVCYFLHPSYSHEIPTFISLGHSGWKNAVCNCRPFRMNKSRWIIGFRISRYHRI